MQKRIKQAIKDVIIPLTEAGYIAYCTGGSIRSFLFKEDPHDVDIATDAPDEVIQDLFPGSIDLSKNMNLKVFLASIGNFKYEIAHFRDNETYQNHRHPNTVKFINDAKVDAQRRDFTINGMFMDAYGNIIDYVGGLSDVKNKILRAIGDPTVRFDEDVLRILRGIRFAVQYDLEIEKETYLAMVNNCQHLAELTPERVINEFYKMMILGGFKFSRALEIMKDTGVLGILLPEIAVLQQCPHNLDVHPEGPTVLDHVIQSIRVCESKDPLVLYSVLLHDIGKGSPGCYVLRDKGDRGMRHSYYSHDFLGLPLIENLTKRLKLPNFIKECALFCCKYHMQFHNIRKMKKSKVYPIIEHKYFDVLCEVGYCDAASRTGLFYIDIWKEEQEYIKTLKNGIFSVVNSVTGQRVLDLTNIQPGPKVGEIISKVRKYILNNNEIDQNKIDNIIKNMK